STWSTQVRRTSWRRSIAADTMHETPNPADLPESPLAVRYHVVHTTTYHYGEPVSMCQNEIHLTPRITARQTCLEPRLTIRLAADDLENQIDYFGNAVHFFTIPEAHSAMRVTAEADVRVSSATFIPPELTTPWEQARDFAAGAPVAEALDA